MTATSGFATRAGARASALLWGFVTGATSLLPPRVRYGYVHRITRSLLSRPLTALPALDAVSTRAPAERVVPTAGITCVLGVGAMDIGGIGSVVDLLATRLPARGVVSAVVCVGDGVRAQRLRELGVEVRSVSDHASALRALSEFRPDVVQLHGAPDFLEAAAEESGAPLVPVLHNTEIHFSRDRWRRFSLLMGESVSAIAVSERVRAFHAARLPEGLRSRIAVVPNASPGGPAPDSQERRNARRLLERTVGGRFRDDVVFVCLARYDAQKNIAGTVASFLDCVAAGVHARLVIAGEPSDWVEFRRSDAIRRASRDADRVHLLATSDARTLLAAADAFLLNSFFEGWPVAATEAWAAGLPVILSDVGGARELVERDPERSILAANPAGDSSTVTDARVERARWKAGKQRNSAELGEAILQVIATVRRERSSPLAPREACDGVAAMIDAHARLLREAASAAVPQNANRAVQLSGDASRGAVAI